MTTLHLALIAAGYVVKTGMTLLVWRRISPRVRSLRRLVRQRRNAGRPVLARTTAGSVSRTFRLGPSRARAAGTRAAREAVSRASA